MNYSSGEKAPIPPPYEAQPLAQPAQPTPNVVYVTQPQVGDHPTTMNCPHCNSQITSNMQTEPSTKTHLICLLLCLLGCCCCAPLVYCADDCLAKKHYCPNCNHFLGIYDS